MTDDLNDIFLSLWHLRSASTHADALLQIIRRSDFHPDIVRHAEQAVADIACAKRALRESAEFACTEMENNRV